MTQPTNYTPQTDFSQQEANNASGRSTVNTAALDAEFAAIENTLDQTLANLQLIQRDDGKLKDVTVEVRCLSQDVLNVMGGFNLTGLWSPATSYAVNDICSNGEYTYVCKTAHTSGGSFSATNWIQFGFTTGTDAAQAAANAQSAANAAAASQTASAASALNASNAASSASSSANTATTASSAASLSAAAAAAAAVAAANSAAAAGNAETLAGVTPTAAGLSLLDDANAAAQRVTLGLGTAATATAPGSAIVGVSDTQTLSNKSFSDSVSVGSSLGVGASPSANRGFLQVAQSGISGGNPVSSGSTDANQFAAIGNSNVSIRFGVYASGAVWIQPSLIGNYSTNFDLTLMPNGGKIVNPQVSKAWVNFDGTLSGTITPRSNSNISSITKVGTGSYTLNFTYAMTDANYAAFASTNVVISNGSAYSGSVRVGGITKSTTALSVEMYSSGGPVDASQLSVIVYGN